MILNNMTSTFWITIYILLFVSLTVTIIAKLIPSCVKHVSEYRILLIWPQFGPVFQDKNKKYKHFESQLLFLFWTCSILFSVLIVKLKSFPVPFVYIFFLWPQIIKFDSNYIILKIFNLYLHLIWLFLIKMFIYCLFVVKGNVPLIKLIKSVFFQTKKNHFKNL
jgi:hypothetical protein